MMVRLTRRAGPVLMKFALADFASVAVVKDKMVWMDDGNFIIAAGRNPTIVFKCHQSVLIKHSLIFADMFSLPPSSEIEAYEGVPMVALVDHPDDIRELLAVLYDPTCVIYSKAACAFCLTRA